MENKFIIKFPPKDYKLFFKRIFSIFLFLIFILSSSPISAYDDQTTHPAITDEIVDFYNLKLDQKIPDNFKEQIIQGSIDEDQFPRYFNHFYDPVSFSIGTMGWKGYRILGIKPLSITLMITKKRLITL
ncbi:MAG: hypothetical protein HYV52_03915 [Parcubacteria group bacterium]|nr:hypothetical protein [Parcubacteria group bacterium]